MTPDTVRCVLLLALAASPALAHDASAHARVVLAADTQATACGHKGTIRELRQSVSIDTNAADAAAGPTVLPPASTVRLALSNPGGQRQLAVLGGADELQRFEKQLGRAPDKHYVAPYLAYLEPGQSAQLIWHFTSASACQLQVYTRGAGEPWRPHTTHRFSMPAASTAAPGGAPTEPQS
ncbi:MAG: hypothetical protein ACOY41_01425 [Pseudomonadota bacterium]